VVAPPNTHPKTLNGRHIVSVNGPLQNTSGFVSGWFSVRQPWTNSKPAKPGNDSAGNPWPPILFTHPIRFMNTSWVNPVSSIVKARHAGILDKVAAGRVIEAIGSKVINVCC
jgi:hypothetical protein